MCLILRDVVVVSCQARLMMVVLLARLLRPACGVRRVYAVFFIARFVRGPGGVHRQIFRVVVHAVPDPCSAARTNCFSRLRRVVFRVAEVCSLAIFIIQYSMTETSNNAPSCS